MKAKIKLNVNLHGFKAGSIIDIDVDDDNIPLKKYWRNRLADSVIDNCIELIENNSHVTGGKKKKNKN